MINIWMLFKNYLKSHNIHVNEKSVSSERIIGTYITVGPNQEFKQWIELILLPWINMFELK